MTDTRLLIIGAGAAGISAACSAWRSGCRSITLVDRESAPGGVLPMCVHHGFGLSRYGCELTGPEYVGKLTGMLVQTGVRIMLNTTVLSVSGDKTALLSGADGITEIRFEKLILATGCREKSIGELMIPGTRPVGIYTAGEVQELINIHHQHPGREVLIMGSGDMGMLMARRLRLEGCRVIGIVEKEPCYTGMARNYRRCIEEHDIPMLYSAEVSRIHGEGRLSGVTVKELLSGQERYIPCDTLVSAVGLVPDRALTKGLGDKDWLMLCGNCSRVHNIVDSAVSEAEETGSRAF